MIGVDGARATIQRFEARVDAAQRAAPPTKTRVRSALHHGGAPRCPVRLRRLSYDIILRHGDTLAELFEAHPDDVAHVAPYDMFVGYQRGRAGGRRDPVDLLTQQASWVDEWGTGWRHAAGGSGASPTSAPLEDWDDLTDYLDSRMPDAGLPGRLDGCLPAVAALGPSHYLVGTTHQAIWERYAQLRGTGQAFEDLAVRCPERDRLLDAVVEYQLTLIRRWASLGSVDAVFLTDDWGSQRSLLIDPLAWRTIFAPRYRRLVETAHDCGLDVIFHSCGNIAAIMGALIDLGVDVIDPLQPEALDLAWVAREYGGEVSFAGGLPVQVLPTMRPDEVHDTVRRLVDLLGAPYGNALILAPSNSLLADVPLANLKALFAACHET
jgi:uroporphyrinogen decarboxylase